MIFSENSSNAYLYFFIAGVVFLFMFLIYVFICDHKVSIIGDTIWEHAFLESGFTMDQIANITHDDTMWYYKFISTCVAYGNGPEKCKIYEHYCSGGDTYGTSKLQSLAVKNSVKNNGEHPLCPLIYPGGD